MLNCTGSIIWHVSKQSPTHWWRRGVERCGRARCDQIHRCPIFKQKSTFIVRPTPGCCSLTSPVSWQHVLSCCLILLTMDEEQVIVGLWKYPFFHDSQNFHSSMILYKNNITKRCLAEPSVVKNKMKHQILLTPQQNYKLTTFALFYSLYAV